MATGAGTIFSSGSRFTGTVTEGNTFTLVMSNPDVTTAGSCTLQNAAKSTSYKSSSEEIGVERLLQIIQSATTSK